MNSGSQSTRKPGDGEVQRARRPSRAGTPASSSPNATPTEARLSTVEMSAIGTLRNAPAHDQQGQQQHEPDHQRQPRAAAGRRSPGTRRLTADGVLRRRAPSSAAGTRSARSSRSAVVDRGSDSLVRHCQRRASRSSVRRDAAIGSPGRDESRRRSAVGVQLGQRGAHRASCVGRVGRAPRRRGRRPRSGTPRSICLNVCTSARSGGRVSRLAACSVMPSAGTASAITTAPEASSARPGGGRPARAPGG